MKSVFKGCLVIFFVLTFVQVPSVSAKRFIDENQEDTLRGLGQVRLVVNIGLSLEGPTKQGLWKDIAEQLKAIPIRVLPEDMEESNWLPALFVDIAVLKTSRQNFFFLATARVYQQVSLHRDANIHAPGITWRYWLVGEGGMENIRERVKVVMDRFISDFQAANHSEQ